MYSAGRQGLTDNLGLEAGRAGRPTRGADQGRRRLPHRRAHIFAVGDVIGFPALAATSMDQGRLAAHPAFDEPAAGLDPLQPIGIYTIPEISYWGRTEAELTEADPLRGRHLPLPRAGPRADRRRLLRDAQAARHTETHKLLGVHVFGTSATELVHIGQAIMGVRRHRRLSRQHRLQLPDAVRGLQGRRARRDEQDAPGGPLQPVSGQHTRRIGLRMRYAMATQQDFSDVSRVPMSLSR